jgi:hypothetical protein
MSEHDQGDDAVVYIAALRRRRNAAFRAGPVVVGDDPGLRNCDPWLRGRRSGPSTFELRPDERRREIRRLAALGWSLDEIAAVIDVEAAA